MSSQLEISGFLSQESDDEFFQLSNMPNQPLKECRICFQSEN
jgi:hypothetical protein